MTLMKLSPSVSKVSKGSQRNSLLGVNPIGILKVYSGLMKNSLNVYKKVLV